MSIVRVLLLMKAEKWDSSCLLVLAGTLIVPPLYVLGKDPKTQLVFPCDVIYNPIMNLGKILRPRLHSYVWFCD